VPAIGTIPIPDIEDILDLLALGVPLSFGLLAMLFYLAKNKKGYGKDVHMLVVSLRRGNRIHYGAIDHLDPRGINLSLLYSNNNNVIRAYVNLNGERYFGIFDPVSIYSVAEHYFYYAGAISSIVQNIDAGYSRSSIQFGGPEMSH
jgi:hypothetical protein